VSTYNIPPRHNREGLTFIEWIHAAGKLATDRRIMAFYAAWQAGEDPTEWRAAQGKVSP
jgi:hypothetical protein